MDIALWNIERACTATPSKRAAVQARINSIAADILVLTEASTAVGHPQLPFLHNSAEMPALDIQTLWQGNPLPYRAGEMRTRILSRYPLMARHPVADPLTNSCADLETPEGPIRVLATLVGVVNTKAIWERDIGNLKRDLDTYACPYLILAGDFNVPLPDGLYRERREGLLACCKLYDLQLVLPELAGVIDHVFIGSGIQVPPNCRALITPVPRTTSDHPLVQVSGMKRA